MEQYRISKNDSMEIKGIGILLMLIHHFFTFPDWYVKNYGFDLSNFFLIMREPTKICVAVFAFVTGWALCAKTLTIKTALKRVKKFLIAYWMIYIPFLVASVALGNNVSFENIVLEAFGLHVPIMIFCWYVYFYIISLILICLTQKIMNRSAAYAFAVGILCPMLCFFVLKKVCSGSILENFFYHLAQWYPCISMGYIANKYNFFLYFKNSLKNLKCKNCIMVVVAIFAMLTRNLFDKLDFLYVVFFVFAVCELLNYNGKSDKSVKRFLRKWGGISMFVWFIHCAFFSETLKNST